MGYGIWGQSEEQFPTAATGMSATSLMQRTKSGFSLDGFGFGSCAAHDVLKYIETADNVLSTERGSKDTLAHSR